MYESFKWSMSRWHVPFIFLSIYISVILLAWKIEGVVFLIICRTSLLKKLKPLPSPFWGRLWKKRLDCLETGNSVYLYMSIVYLLVSQWFNYAVEPRWLLIMLISQRWLQHTIYIPRLRWRPSLIAYESRPSHDKLSPHFSCLFCCNTTINYCGGEKIVFVSAWGF